MGDVTKRMLHTLDLLDSDAGVDVLVNNCVKATDVEGRPYIFFIALKDLKFVVILWAGRKEGGKGFIGRNTYHFLIA